MVNIDTSTRRARSVRGTARDSPDARATAMRPTALLQVQTRRNQNTGASRKEILSTGQFAPQKSANSTRSA